MKMAGKGLLILIGLKVLVIMTPIVKHCYFGCLRPPDVDEIKIL